jgi:hypothetical protein
LKGKAMPPHSYTYPCDPEKAAYVKWAVYEQRWSQTHTAIVVGLNCGTVNHIVRGRRFPNVHPKPIPGF